MVKPRPRLGVELLPASALQVQPLEQEQSVQELLQPYHHTL